MAKRSTTDEKIQALNALAAGADADVLHKELHHALHLKNNFVVAKAAKICGEKLLYDCIDALYQAWHTFMQKPLERDKTCAAKRAIARALFDLDFDNFAFYIDGIHYIQMEPVYGGHVDTAVDVRCTCAMGLASSGHPRVIIELLPMLYDDDMHARMGAVKAMEVVKPFEAEMAIRQKILAGDPEPTVIGQCFDSLLRIEPEYSADFIAAYLQDPVEEIGEYAALALGESRSESALAHLLEQCHLDYPNLPRAILFRALALSRRDQAQQFLLDVIENEADSSVAYALQALATFYYDDDISARVMDRLEKRGDIKLIEYQQTLWREQAD